MPKVVVTGEIHETGMDLLRAQEGYQIEIVKDFSTPAAVDALSEADALLIRTCLFNKDHIARAQRLKVVSRNGVGYDAIDVAALSRAGIPLAIAGNANTVSVAEHAFFLLIAAAKAALRYDAAVRALRWSYRDSFDAVVLAGKRLLIVGAGRIGREMGRRAEAFGMVISYFDPAVESLPEFPNWRREETLHTAVAYADAVSVHVPLTHQTRNLFDGALFARHKRGSILISTARGGVVNESALADALRSGQLHSAGIDVFEAEPVNRENPLLGIDSVILSPHSAALSQEGAQQTAIVAAQNCIDGLQGQLNPDMVVNREALGM
jgi:D-3-phosphoglycerate dehydrogenase